MADSRQARSLPERPLSPHLQIYRFTWTMAMSVVHRGTGMAIYAAILLMVIWLGAAASGPVAYDCVAAVLGSWPGIVVLIGLTWALIHHTIGGVRHMVWDSGIGLDRTSRMLWAKATLVGSLALTVIVWLLIYAGG